MATPNFNGAMKGGNFNLSKQRAGYGQTALIGHIYNTLKNMFTIFQH